MKILFLGHFHEDSGWSKGAINLVKAMDIAGLDVVCRSIKLTDTNKCYDTKIQELENKTIDNVDICIQNVLPHHLVKTDKFAKNIAYFVGESVKMKHFYWFNYLELMDEVWVPNSTLQQHLAAENIATKLSVIPYPSDINQYNAEKEKLYFGSNNYKFKFYYIGELNDRKNIESIIRCFHAEFSPYEPVSLVLKVKKFGSNKDKLKEEVKDMCDKIKKQMRLYSNLESYHEEIIITEDVHDDVISSLHRSCNCFVSPTHGEGWSIPSFDAMCYGNTPICSNEGGPKEFIDANDKNTGWLIDGMYNICNHGNPAFKELFTGADEWFMPSERAIKQAMRFYYEHRDTIDKTIGIKNAERFSYINIGKKIKDILNDC